MSNEIEARKSMIRESTPSYIAIEVVPPDHLSLRLNFDPKCDEKEAFSR